MIPYSKQNISERDLIEVGRVMKSAFLTQGPEVVAFEDKLKERFSVNNAITCSSGTAALHLSYASVGVNEKTIGIVPAITFSATANAFRYLGAEVLFCDVTPDSGLICLDSLEQILKKVNLEEGICPGVISPVSFAGSTAPIPGVRKLASRYGFKVIEDASHSPGSFTSEGEPFYKSSSCIHSDAACLSFHPVKHICCGEGGAVLTNDDQVGEKARKLRSHGIERPFNDEHETPWYYQQTDLGWNYRLTDVQATLGRSQLARLDEQLVARHTIAKVYDRAFRSPSFSEFFTPPALAQGHAWHLYVLRFKKQGSRNRAFRFLKSRGIQTQIHYMPLYRHPYYEERYGELSLPGAEQFYESCLSIPMYPTLTPAEQKYVIEQLGLFCETL
jgi:dTDP-4-amino-4,6-dideoxygalactose transaminase